MIQIYMNSQAKGNAQTKDGVIVVDIVGPRR